MLGFLRRRLHQALDVSLKGNSSTCVFLIDKGSIPPSWLFKGLEESDFLNLKHIWTYPKRKGIERALLINLCKEDNIFDSACTAIRELKTRKISNAQVKFPNDFSVNDLLKWSNTAILKNYSYSAKTVKEGNEKSAESFVKNLYLDYDKDISEQEFKLSNSSAKCSLYARDLANTRGSEANPLFLVEKAQEIYNQHPEKLSLEVLKGETLLEKGLNLLYSVGKGATCPAHLVVLSYKGAKDSSNAISIIGKGLTFDTGGLNLKPTSRIEIMYLDKGGACAALGVLKWAVENELPINLICTLAIAENAIGSKSYKPSDIIKSLKGSTVEIGNTDTEGRLCLSDAMTYTQLNYKPQILIDIATLTSACRIALGEETAGLFGNDKDLLNDIYTAGEFYQENVWELPITPEHIRSIKGKTADISNKGRNGYGATCQAAAFLKHFVEKDVKWAHIDIAGPAMIGLTRAQFSAGGTGFGVQLLTRFLTNHIRSTNK